MTPRRRPRNSDIYSTNGQGRSIRECGQRRRQQRTETPVTARMVESRTEAVIMARLSDNPPPWIYKCFVYPTGGNSRYIWLPISHDGGDSQPFWPEDLNISQWFPNGSLNTRIRNVPGTQIPLRHHYHLYFSENPQAAPFNYSLANEFGKSWRGNLIVTKHGRRDTNSVIQMIEPGDRLVLDVIIPLWIQGYQRGDEEILIRIS